MGRRQTFHKRLVDAFGSEQVYYQPPPSVQLKYPCIVYSRSDIELNYGDNAAYTIHPRYQVAVLYTEPDFEGAERILRLPWATFNRHYAVNNVYHDILYVYGD